MSNNLTFPLNKEQEDKLYQLEADAHHALAVAGMKITNAINSSLVPSEEEMESYKAEAIKMETVSNASKWVFQPHHPEVSLNWMLNIQRGCGNKLASEWFSDFMRIVMLNN